MSNETPLAAISKMLTAVFGNQRYLGNYLQWLYRENPDGVEAAVNLMQADDCTAHYAVIPQRWWVNGHSRLLSLSLNTAVAPAARKQGVFVALATDCFKRAHETYQIDAVLGVANASSTPGFIGKLGFRLVQQLPVFIGLGQFWRRVPEIDLTVNRAALTQKLSDFNFVVPTSGFIQRWDAAKLAWRLQSPIATFRLHQLPNCLVVSTLQKICGLKLAIIIKILPLVGQPTPRQAEITGAVCSAYRTPFYLYCGLHSGIKFTGLPLPHRLRPAPLNLIYKPLDEAIGTANDFTPAVFEFLDFDAY